MPDVIQGSPLSGILGTFIPGPVADLNYRYCGDL